MTMWASIRVLQHCFHCPVNLCFCVYVFCIDCATKTVFWQKLSVIGLVGVVVPPLEQQSDRKIHTTLAHIKTLLYARDICKFVYTSSRDVQNGVRGVSCHNTLECYVTRECGARVGDGEKWDGVIAYVAADVLSQ